MQCAKVGLGSQGDKSLPNPAGALLQHPPRTLLQKEALSEGRQSKPPLASRVSVEDPLSYTY